MIAAAAGTETTLFGKVLTEISWKEDWLVDSIEKAVVYNSCFDRDDYLGSHVRIL